MHSFWAVAGQGELACRRGGGCAGGLQQVNFLSMGFFAMFPAQCSPHLKGIDVVHGALPANARSSSLLQSNLSTLSQSHPENHFEAKQQLQVFSVPPHAPPHSKKCQVDFFLPCVRVRLKVGHFSVKAGSYGRINARSDVV